MKLNIFSIALVSLLTYSCSYGDPLVDDIQEDTFIIEENQPHQEAAKEENYEIVLDENQAEELNKETQDAQPVLKDEVVEIQDRVFYGYNSAMITDEAKEILNLQAQWLVNNPEIRITVEGHCDERGTREYNIALGEKRAHAAKKYLVQNGVAANRIQTVSFGKERPAFFGNSREIHAKNRRAVVVEK